MKLWNIDLVELFRFFWDNKERNKLLWIWFGISFVVSLIMLLYIIFSYFGPIYLSMEQYLVGYLIVYILLLIVSNGVGLFTLGVGIDSYNQIVKQDIDFDFSKNIWHKVKQGIKLLLVNLFYSIPMFLLLLILGFMAFLFLELGGVYIMLLICIYGLFLFVAIVFGIFINAAVKPIAFQLIQQGKFKQCFNIALVLSNIGKNKSNILRFFVISLLVGVAWFVIYMISYMLLYLVIGIIFLPLSLAIMSIYMAYIEPKLINIIFDGQGS
jgi:hypothetical protein